MLDVLDFLIIGAGPAGLYAAQYIVDHSTTPISLEIVEQKSFPGGRTRMTQYCGHKVPGGAGVVRNTDPLLIDLCQRHHIPLKFKGKTVYYPFTQQPMHLLDVIRQWKREWQRECTPEKRSKMTFRDFLRSRCPTKEKQEEFINTVGYSDFLDADVTDTLWDYGWKDVVGDSEGGTTTSSLDWNLLCRRMVSSIRRHRHADTSISFSTKVLRLLFVPKSSSSSLWKVTCQNADGKTVHKKARSIILAIPSSSIETLLQHSHFPSKHKILQAISRNVGMQPFLRLYATLPPPSQPKKHGIILHQSSPLQKSIPLFSLPNQQRAWMLSYSDNQRALTTLKSSASTLSSWTENHILPTHLHRVFHREGTHFFKPLPTKYKDRNEFLHWIQHPLPSLYIVGEGFSRNQGWTEGALESVLSIGSFF